MATGSKQDGTDASVELLAASEYRNQVTIVLYDKTAPIAIGIGEDAVADEGVNLREVGDSCTVRGAEARAQINIIGNGGKVSYQLGNVEVKMNGYLA